MQLITDEELLAFTGRQESQYLAKPSDFTDEVLDRFSGDHGACGDVLPWEKTHRHLKFRPGEVTLWGGYSGHGKSQLLGQFAAWNLRYKKWLIASLEMKPSATMYRMVRQMSGNARPPNQFIEDALKFTDERLWIYDQTDSVAADRILGLIHYTAEVKKIDHIIIDSLIKCGIGRENYEAQALFVDKLCWAAKSTGIHIHLVHHMRKGQGSYDEYKVPSKHDYRGAGEITDLVDNVVIVHRNKGKEEKIRKKEIVGDDEADCVLKVDKQRHGEWEGNFKLWFHAESLQYTSNSDNRRIYYDLKSSRNDAQTPAMGEDTERRSCVCRYFG